MKGACRPCRAATVVGAVQSARKVLAKCHDATAAIFKILQPPRQDGQTAAPDWVRPSDLYFKLTSYSLARLSTSFRRALRRTGPLNPITGNLTIRQPFAVQRSTLAVLRLVE